MTSSKAFKIILVDSLFKTNVGQRINADNPATKVGCYSFLFDNGKNADENWKFKIIFIKNDDGTTIASNYNQCGLDDDSIRYYLSALNEGLEIDEVIIETKNGLIAHGKNVKFYIQKNLIEHSCETINELKKSLELIKNKTIDSEIVNLVNSALIDFEKVRTINRNLRDRIKELKSKLK